MKFFAKLMLAALVLAILLPFTVLKNDQGKPLMSFSDFGMPDFKLPDFSSARKLVPASGGAGGVDTFYRWYDAKGNIQFTTEPPPDGVEYTVKAFDPNTNVIQAVQLPVKETVVETPEVSNQPGSVDELDSPYSKESVEKLFEDTKNIEKLLNERIKNQNAAIN